MTNGDALKQAIKDSGMSIVFIANKLECSRNRLYSIIKGADCTASELTQLLHLTKQQRDYIFLSKTVN